MFDVAIQVRKPEVVVKGLHLPKGLPGRPAFVCDAKQGNHDSGAIGSLAAMHENCRLRIFADQFEEFRHLRVGGHAKRTPRDRHEAKAERIYSPLFFHQFTAAVPQIDDDSDSKPFQLGESLFGRLRAPVQMIGDAAKVAHSGKRNVDGNGRRRKPRPLRGVSKRREGRRPGDDQASRQKHSAKDRSADG